MIAHIKKDLTFPEGHLVLLVGCINENDGTIAQAIPLANDPVTKRNTLGLLQINFKEMVNT